MGATSMPYLRAPRHDTRRVLCPSPQPISTPVRPSTSGSQARKAGVLNHRTRVPAWRTPEAIRSHYPTLSLEQVYGAITFYLGHKCEVENAIADRERVEDEFSSTNPPPPYLKEKLERASRQLQ